jgi:pyruvate/2-oxoglutarate dehydrogenase complex dihydrolipoamide dehydrogenase (E3) component
MQRSSGTAIGTPFTALETPSIPATAAETISADLCVIGAGSGGLSIAAAAVRVGLKVVLIEKHKMGGDCLNYGCVPSKALIAAGRRAHLMRNSAPFGIVPVDPAIDYRAVQAHVRNVIATIAPNDSVERFTGMGVQVIQAAGSFVDKKTVMAGDKRIKAHRFVIATGSSPAIPDTPGLDSVPYFTNETIFENQQKLPHLIIIGGGPIGLELAQAHLRLGSQVTVLEALKALGRDDAELGDMVLGHLRSEGIDIREGAKVERIESLPAGRVRIQVATASGLDVFEGTHLLLATGRKPNVEDLNLEAAGIKYDRRGIQVSKGLVTSNSGVFAIGDVTGGLQYTHVANYHAGVVFRRALFRLPARVREEHVPWVTFTDPELAHIGLTEQVARDRHGKINVYRWPYHENDRAQAERATEGFVKVVTDRKGKILGASVVGERAGELIQIWSLAVSQGLKIAAMTQWVSPYPTFNEINKRAAMGYYALAADIPLVRKVVALLRRLG